MCNHCHNDGIIFKNKDGKYLICNCYFGAKALKIGYGRYKKQRVKVNANNSEFYDAALEKYKWVK